MIKQIEVTLQVKGYVFIMLHLNNNTEKNQTAKGMIKYNYIGILQRSRNYSRTRHSTRNQTIVIHAIALEIRLLPYMP